MCKIVLDFKKEYNGKIWYEGEDKIHEALLYFKFNTIKMPLHKVETKDIIVESSLNKRRIGQEIYQCHNMVGKFDSLGFVFFYQCKWMISFEDRRMGDKECTKFGAEYLFISEYELDFSNLKFKELTVDNDFIKEWGNYNYSDVIWPGIKSDDDSSDKTIETTSVKESLEIQFGKIENINFNINKVNGLVRVVVAPDFFSFKEVIKTYTTIQKVIRLFYANWSSGGVWFNRQFNYFILKTDNGCPVAIYYNDQTALRRNVPHFANLSYQKIGKSNLEKIFKEVFNGGHFEDILNDLIDNDINFRQDIRFLESVAIAEDVTNFYMGKKIEGLRNILERFFFKRHSKEGYINDYCKNRFDYFFKRICNHRNFLSHRNRDRKIKCKEYPPIFSNDDLSHISHLFDIISIRRSLEKIAVSEKFLNDFEKNLVDTNDLIKNISITKFIQRQDSIAKYRFCNELTKKGFDNINNTEWKIFFHTFGFDEEFKHVNKKLDPPKKWFEEVKRVYLRLKSENKNVDKKILDWVDPKRPKNGRNRNNQ